MKRLSQIVVAVACLTAVLCSTPVSARAANPPQPVAPALPNSNPTAYVGLDYYAATPFEMGVSTPANQAVLLVSGKGILYGIDCSSGASGDYAIAFDSAPNAAGIAAGTFTANVDKRGLSPAVLSDANGPTTCTSQGLCGSWNPRVPRRFTNGLTAIKSNATTATGTGERCIFAALADTLTAGSSH